MYCLDAFTVEVTLHMTLLATSAVTAVVCGDKNLHTSPENTGMISKNECMV